MDLALHRSITLPVCLPEQHRDNCTTKPEDATTCTHTDQHTLCKFTTANHHAGAIHTTCGSSDTVNPAASEYSAYGQ